MRIVCLLTAPETVLHQEIQDLARRMNMGVFLFDGQCLSGSQPGIRASTYHAQAVASTRNHMCLEGGGLLEELGRCIQQRVQLKVSGGRAVASAERHVPVLQQSDLHRHRDSGSKMRELTSSDD